MAVDITTRLDAGSLIPVDQVPGIIKETTEGSSFLQMARKLPNMPTNVQTQPVLSSLPTAYFVNGDTGQKKTTKMEWGSVTITAEEIAVIVAIPDAVVADAKYDLWGEYGPAIGEAFGVAIDGAAYYSTNKPASWPVGIVPASVAAGNAVTHGTGVDLYDDLLAPGGVIALIEEDGYVPSGHVGAIQFRAQLRGLRDNEGRPIFNSTPGLPVSPYTIDGTSIVFPRNGAVDPEQSLLIAGDWSKAVYAIRQDITVTKSNSAVIQDPSDGSIALNLFQQDATAYRFVMRLGWALPRPVSRVGGANRFPFAVLLPAGA